MPEPVRITEADLRAAMRDPRYWKSGHPEREGFSQWVTKGWKSLLPTDSPAKGSVWVKSYVRDGHRVAAHWRGAPPGGKDGADHDGTSPGLPSDGDDLLTPAQGGKRLWEFLFRRAPADGRGGGRAGRLPPRDRSQRWLDAQGRDPVQEMRQAPETQNGGVVGRDIDQWFRPGGAAGRQRDLEGLGPVGQPSTTPNGGAIHQLPGGRQAMLRLDPESGLTLEIQIPDGKGGFTMTDKFRYR